VGAAFGYTQLLGGYDGGQAQFVRVPYGNTGPLRVPDSVTDEQAIFLSDILPTGYFGADLAGVQVGDDVAVFGAGPAGYFSTLSSFLRGAARVFSIDREPERLKKTRELGAETINFDEQDPVDFIQKATGGKGAVCIDAVGYEAIGHAKAPQVKHPAYERQNPLQALTWITKCARKFSTVGVPGVYVGAYDEFPFGEMFNRELHIKMGQCPVKNYNEQLLHLIEVGRIDPTQIISHTLRLDEAPAAYEAFDKKNGVTKVLLRP
jgi:S-(hydroxymethyl)glutathione dehydrogenase/alcohol dehydrogenase